MGVRTDDDNGISNHFACVRTALPCDYIIFNAKGSDELKVFADLVLFRCDIAGMCGISAGDTLLYPSDWCIF